MTYIVIKDLTNVRSSMIKPGPPRGHPTHSRVYYWGRPQSVSRSVYSYVPKSRYHAILWRRCCILSTKNLHRVMLAPWKTTAPIDVGTCMHVGWNINSRSLLLVGCHDPLYKGDKPLCGLADGHDCAILNIMPSHEPNCWRRGGEGGL